VTRDFICFGDPDATVVVADATCLERNLNLVLQVMEITPRAILGVNLIDEARRKKVKIDTARLEGLLGIPVIPTVARDKVGLNQLKDAIHRVAFGKQHTAPKQLVYNKTIETAITEIQKEVEVLLQGKFNSRWVALRLLDGDTTIITEILNYLRKMQSNPVRLIQKCERLGCS
jgi:ferrous iron transport protein B